MYRSFFFLFKCMNSQYEWIVYNFDFIFPESPNTLTGDIINRKNRYLIAEYILEPWIIRIAERLSKLTMQLAK